MRKLLVSLLVGGSLLAMSVPAQAAKEHLGSFTYVKYGPNYKHRVFLKVESSNNGDKSCDVLLNGRIQGVDLGTDGESQVFNMFYLRVAGAVKAYNQAKAAPSPTTRIRCSH